MEMWMSDVPCSGARGLEPEESDQGEEKEIRKITNKEKKNYNDNIQ